MSRLVAITVFVLVGCGYERVTPEAYEIAKRKCAESGGLDYIVAQNDSGNFRAGCKDGTSIAFKVGHS